MHSTFKGSIDDLLNHCSTLDADEATRLAENGDGMLSREEAIDVIMQEGKMNREDATKFFEDCQMEELDEALKHMQSLGIVEIVEYDAANNGEPIYGLTEMGKLYAEELKKKK